jgi:hypothetical protein
MNLIDDIIWRVAQIASLAYQERYLTVGATRDEYIREDELLEFVDSIKYRVRLPENEAALTAAQRGALEDLWAYLDAYGEDALSVFSTGSVEEQAILFRESVIWKTLRAKAGSILQLFGLPAEMSIAEINRRTGTPNLPH